MEKFAIFWGTSERGGVTTLQIYNEKLTIGGWAHVNAKLRTDVGIDKIKDYLMSRIDITNPVEVEKVGRYLKNIEIYRRMERTVKKEGVSVTINNGSQSFLKSHPLLNEMSKANSSIMNIERTFNFIDDDDKKKQYTANDLI